MSDLDDLAEQRAIAAEIGQVARPDAGKRRFGKVGLTDPGQAGVRLGRRGPTATPEEVEAFLRGNAASDWGASVGSAARRQSGRRRRGSTARVPKPKPHPGRMSATQSPAIRRRSPPYRAARSPSASDVPQKSNAPPQGEARPWSREGKEVVGVRPPPWSRPPPQAGRPHLDAGGRRGGAAPGDRRRPVAEAERRASPGCGLVEVTSNKSARRPTLSTNAWATSAPATASQKSSES